MPGSREPRELPDWAFGAFAVVVMLAGLGLLGVMGWAIVRLVLHFT